MVSEREWKWIGKAGHLIVGHDCVFHLCTVVGNKLISTVGDYHPYHKRGNDGLGEAVTIGAGRLYETYVFRVNSPRIFCSCGCGLPDFDPTEIDSLPANAAGEATANHMAMCRKYAENQDACPGD